jgi:UDP-glucose 4-epimerase
LKFDRTLVHDSVLEDEDEDEAADPTTKNKRPSMKYFVTGGAGFIASNLVDRLLESDQEVVAYDNFSTGQERFIEKARTHESFSFIRGDTTELAALKAAMEGADFVFHLSANADVRFGLEHPRKDLEQNTIATFNVLEAMRSHGIKQMAFSSTGSIYGEPDTFPTPENAPLPVQTSLYGATKLACEGLIQAYSEGYGVEASIFRFVSILGERYSHGHVYDFHKSLREDPTRLTILGDGHQRKSYLYIQDCCDAMLIAIQQPRNRVNVYNLGTDEHCEVNDSVGWICEHLGISPQLDYTGGKRGWVGDSPFIFLDCREMRSLGWAPKLSIRDAVIRTLSYLQENTWLYDARDLRES